MCINVISRKPEQLCVFYTKMLLLSTLTGLRLQRHNVAQDAQLGTVMGAVGRGDIGGSMGGRSLCAIEFL
jgi:hypothetical protein